MTEVPMIWKRFLHDKDLHHERVKKIVFLFDPNYAWLKQCLKLFIQDLLGSEIVTQLVFESYSCFFVTFSWFLFCLGEEKSETLTQNDNSPRMLMKFFLECKDSRHHFFPLLDFSLLLFLALAGQRLSQHLSQQLLCCLILVW